MIYRLRYCNKDGVEARVDITTPGSPIVKEIEGTENPFVLSYKGDKSDKSSHFLTSSAEINIYETPEFNIDKLKTSNETQIKVDHFIDDQLNWTGFVIPDFFSREIGGAGIVSMTASDRISTLKGVTLSDLPAMVQIRDLAVRCLARTGLDLPLKTMADFRADDFLGFNHYFRSEISSQRLYDSKGRSISCYDILKSILVASGSTLRQRGGEWHIINKLQHEAGVGRVYSTENTSVDYVESVHHFNEIVKGARRTIIPVAGSVGIYHEYGGGKLYPDNYDFSQGISGWTTYNGFDCEINNKEVLRYIQDLFYWRPSLGDDTGKNNLRCNRNSFNPSANDNPYVESPPIIVTYPDSNSVEVSININAISTGAFIAAVSYINFSVIAKAPDNSLYSLGGAGSFAKFSGNPHFLRERVRAETSGDTTTVFIGAKGVLTVDDDNLEGYNFYVRIYGSGVAFTPFINSVSVSFVNPSDNPKGLIYKREQGVNFTKTHEIDTSIFGDFMTGGFNGYFYPYPIDDTSSLRNPYSGISSLWTTPYFPTETEALPLLQHVVRQQARMFSVAHDLISGEIEMSEFDPLSIFVDCNGKRYVIVSASFDFLRSSVKVELEEIAYANLTVRDYIYSYFGEGESGIKSVGGIASGTGGGGGAGGGGLTPEQLEILSFWKKDPDNPNTIFTEMNAYSKLELSAYGAGTGGGGSGIIQTVYGYNDLGGDFNNSILTDTFNAYTVNRLASRLTAVESGAAVTVNVTGSGNAITNITKSGTVITANKDLTFSLSGHTHAISDISGLQTTLNSKLETSIFNTHNNDNIRHITGAERTKWDGVVTDFGNLEVGGRNLFRYDIRTNNSAVTWDKENRLITFILGSNRRIDKLGFNGISGIYTVNLLIKANKPVRVSIDLCDYSPAAIDVGADEYIRFTRTYNHVNKHTGAPYFGFLDFAPTDTSAILYIKELKVERGNKPTDHTDAPEDVQSEITEAKQEALTAANNVQTNVDNLNTYVTGAFKDGLIDEAEAKAIEKYLNTINETMAKAEASYDKVFKNTYLPEGAAKTSLLNAKINLWGQRDTLLSTINSAIADGKTTIAEKNAVDSAFNTFNSLMSAFQSALEDANKAIQVKLDDISKGYVDNLEVGGRNLIKESDPMSAWTGQHNVSTNSNAFVYTNPAPHTSAMYQIEARAIDDNMVGAELGWQWSGELKGKTVILTKEWQKATAYFDATVPIGLRVVGGLGLIELQHIKVEKGTIPTDWTPAPEDQVSDWNTTDVNSFSFIKNKPTSLSQFTDNIGVAAHIANKSNPHSVTKAQVGLGNVDNTPDSAKNVLSATKLHTARTIAGVSFDGTANIAIPFANLSSKPTTLGGYGITDAVTLNTAQTISGEKTFSDTVTAPTFSGALSGNASSATKLQTPRTIWGQSFDGSGDVTGALSGATAIAASISVTTPKVIFNAAGWSMEQVGSELQMKHNNVLKMRFTSTGSIIATEEITAFG